jgi:hypothetical protein
MNGFHSIDPESAFRETFARGQRHEQVPWLERVLVGAWERHKLRRREGERKKATATRIGLLNPNENSDIKVEKYVFSLNPTIFSNGADSLVFGIPNGWTAFKNPQVVFRATNLAINVPCPGLVYVENLQAANLNGQIGSVADGYLFAAPHGKEVSLPTLPPQNTMQVQGTWSNHVPAAYRADTRAARRERQERLTVLVHKKEVVTTLLAGSRGARKKELQADLQEVAEGLARLALPQPAPLGFARIVP